ncbi:MAG: hypothetical protein U9R37_05825 [Campylobacterota bacterium]|nr:hypothetical protein [Campylobacterota bacterium]
MKLILLFFFTIQIIVYGKNIQVVPVSNKIINYKNKIYSSDVRLIQINKKYFCKEYLDIKTLKENKYLAKHYIAKDKPLCKKSVYVPKSKKVKFKFGNLEIERDGEVIKETDNYIKIKNLDGTIDKIYKDGINR